MSIDQKIVQGPTMLKETVNDVIKRCLMLIVVSYSRNPMIISRSLHREAEPSKFILEIIFTQILQNYSINTVYKHLSTLMKMKLHIWASQYQPLISTHAHIRKKCSSIFIFLQHIPFSILITRVRLFCVLRASSSQNVQQMCLQLFLEVIVVRQCSYIGTTTE